MGLCAEVRRACAEIARSAQWVEIHPQRMEALERLAPAPASELDPERHYLEGAPEEVTMYMLTLDSINFGSGWFPTLRKRPGCSGYYTVAWALADRFRELGPWSAAGLRGLEPGDLARVLGQDDGHELMALYARALNHLGGFLGDRSALEAVEAAGGSAERFAEQLAAAMPFFDDHGFYKRAQITPNNLSLAGVAGFHDLDSLTIFADNLVPHVLRMEGVLSYHPELAARIDAGVLLAPGPEEQEIRACAVHACESISARLGLPSGVLDTRLWNLGQQPRFKAVPRHRTRTVFY